MISGITDSLYIITSNSIEISYIRSIYQLDYMVISSSMHKTYKTLLVFDIIFMYNVKKEENRYKHYSMITVVGDYVHMKTITQKKNTLFLSWMISYAVILIVPIIIASFTYMVSIDIIKEEVNRAHSASLEQIKFIVDGKVQEIDRLSSELSLNQRLRALMYSKRSMETKEILGIT